MLGLQAFETMDGTGPIHMVGGGEQVAACGQTMLRFTGDPWPPLRSQWGQDAALCPACEQAAYGER